MVSQTSRLNRLPAAERGITIADFFVPVSVGERLSTRARDLVLVVAGALFVALCAQLTIVQEGQTIPLLADFSVRLGDSPVPITGQTFGVLLVGAALGMRRGGFALALYVLLGFVLPVYAGGSSGADTIISRQGGQIVLGATGGYLIGFIVAATVTGRLAELGWDRRIGGALAAMFIGNVIIYLVGIPWLAMALPDSFAGDRLGAAIRFGLAPFIVVDLIKLVLAAALFPIAWWVVDRRPEER